MNTVQLIGRIATDILLHETKNDKVVATFNLALNDYKTTYFIPVTLWETLATNVNTYCKKGTKIALTGHLRQDSYENDDGKHYKVYVVAKHIEFLSSKEE